MKYLILLLALVFAGFPATTSAQSPTKNYLKLGADPQAANRQPVAGKEHVVILADEICDSGWGSGSGKKVKGCYPAHSAVIVNNETDEIVAMYVCGNEPSEKHKAVGKNVPDAMLSYVPVPGPKGDKGEDAKLPTAPVGITGPQRLDLYVHFPDTMQTKVTGKVELDVVAQATANTQVRHDDDGGGFPGWAKAVLVVGAAAALTDLGIHIFRHHDNVTAPVTKGPGVTSDSSTTHKPGVTSDTSTVTHKPCSNGLGTSCLRSPLGSFAGMRSAATPYLAFANRRIMLGVSIGH